MFNLWKHVRTASCVVLFLSIYLNNVHLLWFGFMLIMSGLIGGLDLAERRIEVLEKEKNDNAEVETPEDN